MVLSFPIGAYVFFNSEIGESINHQFPISELEIIKHIDADWISTIEIGHIFIVMWAFFAIIFTIATLGPKKNFVKMLSPISTGAYESHDGNYIVNVIRWFSIIVVLSGIIDLIQQYFGITISSKPFENDLLQLFDVTLAPIVEEIGFRVILIGVPLFLFYSHGASGKSFFKSLWNPSSNLAISDFRKPLILIIIIGIFFGLSHIISDQWSLGKFTQAAMSGIIIGWAYYRYGLVAALLIHWAANYMVFAYGYLVSSVNEIKVMDAFSHSLIQTIEVLLIVTGILAIVLMYFERIITKKQMKGPTSN